MIGVGIIVSLIIFSVLVLLHEYGHYKTARMCGIAVEEFGLGLPPRAKKLWKNKQGTLFSLNWIPLGGFVKITGESEIQLSYYDKNGRCLDLQDILKHLKNNQALYTKKGDEIGQEEKQILREQIVALKPGQNFFEKNIFQKSLVLLAGVCMNIFIAYVLFFLLFAFGVKPVGVNSFIETKTDSFLIPSYEHALELGIIEKQAGVRLYPIEGSLAANAGVQDGDILLSIENTQFFEAQDVIEYLQPKGGNEIYLEILRNNTAMQISLRLNKEGKMGAYLGENIEVNEEFRYNFTILQSAVFAAKETYSQLELTFRGLGSIVSRIFFPKTDEERSEAIDQLSGPIGIVQVVTLSLGSGIQIILILTALISISLAVFNLLPIPALDGGRLALLWIRSGVERIFGKNSTIVNIENTIHVIFFMLLIALSIIIAYNDIYKIFSN